VVSTFKLVDDLDEQATLESLINQAKPPVPPDCRHLHYLLSTPFRYGAPYPGGSRFRRAGQTEGVFYASSTVETAICEAAFWRLLFFAESPDTPWPSNPAAHTAFSTDYASDDALDLTAAPLIADRADWVHPTDYAPCQDLADRARNVAIEVIRYESVRDPRRRANIAIMRCAAFSTAEPTVSQTWRIHLGDRGVRAIGEFPPARIEFGRFESCPDPRLAAIRWQR